MLPLSPPGLGNSPYSAISAFAGNPLLISLERLAEHGWMEKDQLRKLPAPKAELISTKSKAIKMPLLQQAAQNFLERGNGERGRFEEFKRDHAWWLEDFVLFDVMRQVHKGATWSSWPKELARREAEGLHKFGVEHQRELEFERAIQFAFFEQWRSLHKYCRQRGIGIVGDVAIFVNYDSADVWRNPDLFFSGREPAANRGGRCPSGRL